MSDDQDRFARIQAATTRTDADIAWLIAEVARLKARLLVWQGAHHALESPLQDAADRGDGLTCFQVQDALDDSNGRFDA